jgi:serine/threonine protein kinase
VHGTPALDESQAPSPSGVVDLLSAVCDLHFRGNLAKIRGDPGLSPGIQVSMPLSVQNVYGLLLRSKLLPIDDSRSIFERWKNEAKNHADDLERFRRWLINHHYLTEYQVNLLCRGHADGFFVAEYKIMDRLGRGRMAGVYKAVHPTGQVVAIKVLPPSKAKDPYLLSRFQREAKLALQLKHANVVRTFQLGTAEKLHYIVMEYLEGETLEDVLCRRKRLPPAEATRIIYQALTGLQHIHEQGMVHRDLKPSNIMLTPARVSGQPDTTARSTIKILDIGLGRAFFDENAQVPKEDDQLTSEGVLLGTPDYLAPEQARNARGVDIRADIYSAGCVLYACLAGHPPFPDTNIINQMIRHASENPKPLKEINPEVPDGLQLIVNYMMAKDPNQRYATPDRAAQALQVFLAAGAEPARPLEADASMSSYLNWLEGSQRQAPVAAAVGRPPGTPVALPANDLPTAEPAEPSERKKKKSRRHKKRRKAPVAAGVAPPPNMGDIDVELVPAGPAGVVLPGILPAAPLNRARPSSGRRKFLLLVGGAVSVAAAVAIGGIAASGGVTPFLRRLGIGDDEEGTEEKK